MNLLMLALSLHYNVETVYVNKSEITTVSETQCRHVKYSGGLFTSSEITYKPCTEILLRNGKYLYVNDKASEIMKTKERCK